MSLTIHQLIAALQSDDVWDLRIIDERPVPETIATLREYAWARAFDQVRERGNPDQQADDPTR